MCVECVYDVHVLMVYSVCWSYVY